MQQGFDTSKYLKAQSDEILKRVKMFDKRLYLEFGGKLYYDSHAARVLPGYQADAKAQLLKKLSNNMDIVYCVSAPDIERGKISGSSGLTYDSQTLKDIEELRERGLNVSCVAITIYNGEHRAARFKKRLERLGVKVHLFSRIEGYPDDLDKVVSDNGYGSQPYIEFNKPLVVVTGAGGGSGKMFLCLSQLYHDYKHGVKSGFSKFETFPIWNLPINHPVNMAYEAATADLGDYNMIDPFHKKAYGKSVVNYNRDVENFELLKGIFERILGKVEVFWFKSPTDMGVNKASEGILDNAVVSEAAKQEIVRRYFWYKKELMLGEESETTFERSEAIMKKAGLAPEDRPVVLPARKSAKENSAKKKGESGIYCGAALQLKNGKILPGKNSAFLHSASASILNAIKELAGIDDAIHLIQPDVIKNINTVKHKILKRTFKSLNVDEVLIALAASLGTKPEVEKAVEKLSELNGCEMHLTHMLSSGDEEGVRKLSINVTSDCVPVIKHVPVD